MVSNAVNISPLVNRFLPLNGQPWKLGQRGSGTPWLKRAVHGHKIVARIYFLLPR